jgi:hypothetical protein
MTPNDDHATLFQAPPAAPTAEADDPPESTIDSGAAAMRELRHPFEVQSGVTTASTENGRPQGR